MSKLTIQSIEAIIVDLPLRRLQRFAAVGANSTSIVLVRMRTKDGLEGIGEAVTPSGPWWGGESVETIKLMIDEQIAPMLTGADAFDLAPSMARLDRALFGNAFAKASVEMAMLDLQGKALGVPVHDLMGGKRRASLPCSWPLATGEASSEIEEAERMLESKRHNIFKLKMGAVDPVQDVERACAVARGLEGRASVRGDPNEMWDETTTKWAVPRMADAGIVMVEQPMARWNLAASARLTARSNCAIMIDEGLCTPQDMLRIAEMRAADLVSLKVMKSAGLLATRRIADIAEAGGISLYMGTFLECSIGTAANMQLCATLADLPFGGELSGPGLVAEDIAVQAARYVDFELQLEEGVGLAVEVDEDKLKAFRRDRTYSVHASRKSMSAKA